jgi:hypothetical protein
MVRNQRDETLVIENPGSGASGNGIFISDSHTAANASQAITISALGPANIGTATISKWLTVNLSGTTYFIPMWT